MWIINTKLGTAQRFTDARQVFRVHDDDGWYVTVDGFTVFECDNQRGADDMIKRLVNAFSRRNVKFYI